MKPWRWLRGHWRSTGTVAALVLTLVLGALLQANYAGDERQDNDLAEVVTELGRVVEAQAADRIASDVASCESGNRVRAEIRQLPIDLGAKPEAVDAIASRFPDRDCSAIPGGTSVPTIPTPSTTEAHP